MGAIENSDPNRIHLYKYYFKNGRSVDSEMLRKAFAEIGAKTDQEKLTFVNISFIGIVVMEIIFNNIVNYLNN